MASYRELWFKNNKGIAGRYQCRHCKGWFNKSEIDIDHIIPRKYGGTDTLSNLQPLCKHCNRSKKADVSKVPGDLTKNVATNAVKSAVRGLFFGK